MATRDPGPESTASAVHSAVGKRTIHHAYERRNALIRIGRDPRWPTGPGPIKHGTSAYHAARCRGENGRACDRCRAAVAAAVAASRARKAAAAAGGAQLDTTRAPDPLA